MYKGKQEEPVTRQVPITVAQLQEIQDHALRFETINLFQKVLSDFKAKGVDGLKADAEKFVQKLKKIEDKSEFVSGLLDTIERQTLAMLEKTKYIEKWGEH